MFTDVDKADFIRNFQLIDWPGTLMMSLVFLLVYLVIKKVAKDMDEKGF